MFGKHWQKAECTVIAKEVASAREDTIDYRYAVEVRPEGEPAFRAQAALPFNSLDFWAPAVGDSVGVEFDRKSGKVRFDRTDPRLSAKAYEAGRAAAFDAALASNAAKADQPIPDYAELRASIIRAAGFTDR